MTQDSVDLGHMEYNYCPCFSDEDTEGQRGQVTS